jgi:hypothetical protein
MSRDELVAAYTEGAISRRTFIRRLVGMGVTLGAAVTYASVLSPTVAAAQTDPHDALHKQRDQSDLQRDYYDHLRQH